MEWRVSQRALIVVECVVRWQNHIESNQVLKRHHHHQLWLLHTPTLLAYYVQYNHRVYRQETIKERINRDKWFQLRKAQHHWHQISYQKWPPAGMGSRKCRISIKVNKIIIVDCDVKIIVMMSHTAKVAFIYFIVILITGFTTFIYN